MGKVKTVILLLMICLALQVDAQRKRRYTIPVSIGISEVFNYHIQMINLGTPINSDISVGNGIVEDGSLVDPDGNYKLVGNQSASDLQYREHSKGFDLTLDIPFIQMWGIGVGMQYNFDARDRLRYYLRFYHVFMDWDQNFHIVPAFKLGIKQFYAEGTPQDNFFIGGEVDLDIRICSRLYAFVSAGIEYSRNSHYYVIRDTSNGPNTTFNSSSKQDNMAICGSYGLKIKFWKD
jgi:hypothetical protein